jgi:hypothetical protein
VRTSIAKSFVVAAVAVLAVAACAESPTDTTTQLGKGVSNPNTNVTGAFVVHIEGSLELKAPGVYTRGSGNSTEVHYCDEAGAKWSLDRNGALKNQTGSAPHQHCIAGFTPGYDITITFSSVANYVLPTGGNYQLNFTQSCTTVEGITTCVPIGVQYKKTGNFTLGTGGLATDADGRVWTIDFQQPLLQSPGNLLADRTLYLVARNAELGCWPGQMTW